MYRIFRSPSNSLSPIDWRQPHGGQTLAERLNTNIKLLLHAFDILDTRIQIVFVSL